MNRTSMKIMVLTGMLMLGHAAFASYPVFDATNNVLASLQKTMDSAFQTIQKANMQTLIEYAREEFAEEILIYEECVKQYEECLKDANGRMWVKHHAGMYAKGLDLLNGTVDMFAGLVVEGDDVGASLGEGFKILLRFHNHQVDIQGFLGFLFDGLHHGDAEGDVRHEAAVHHVAVEPVGLAAVDHLDVVFQVQEVGRQ